MQNESSQDRRLVKTGTPGIYKRDGRYVVRYRTLADATASDSYAPSPRPAISGHSSALT
jgi:hypothetical protein